MRKSVAAVTTALPPAKTAGAAWAISRKVRVPSAFQRMNIATRKPKSPIRLTMNAFLPASALAFSLNQKPISR